MSFCCCCSCTTHDDSDFGYECSVSIYFSIYLDARETPFFCVLIQSKLSDRFIIISHFVRPYAWEAFLKLLLWWHHDYETIRLYKTIISIHILPAFLFMVVTGSRECENLQTNEQWSERKCIRKGTERREKKLDEYCEKFLFSCIISDSFNTCVVIIIYLLLPFALRCVYIIRKMTLNITDSAKNENSQKYEHIGLRICQVCVWVRKTEKRWRNCSESNEKRKRRKKDTEINETKCDREPNIFCSLKMQTVIKRQES